MSMIDGQLRDVVQTGSSGVTTDQVERSVVSKNGEAKAFFAAMGALRAGADPDRVGLWARFGRALGVVLQLQSDRYELFHAEEAQDLIQGTRTLQVAIAMEMMDSDSRTDFLRLLQTATTEREARDEVVGILRHPRYAVPWTRVVKRWSSDALDALDSCDAQEPWGEWLRELVTSNTPAC